MIPSSESLRLQARRIVALTAQAWGLRVPEYPHEPRLPAEALRLRVRQG